MSSLKSLSVESIAFAMLCLALTLQLLPMSSSIVASAAPATHEWRQSLLDRGDTDAVGRVIVEQDLVVSVDGRSHLVTVEREPVDSLAQPSSPSTLSIVPDATAVAIWRFVGWVGIAGLSFFLFGHKMGLWIVTSVFILGLVEAVYGLSYINGGSSFGLQTKVHFMGSATGSFVSKNHFAAMIYISLGSAISLMLIGWRRRVITAGIILLGAALLLSMSRGGILATVVATIVFWPNISRRIAQRPSTKLLAGILLLVGVATTGIWGRFAKLFEGDSSLTGRINIWNDATELWLRSPYFGSGLGSFDDAGATVGDLPMVFRFAHAHSEPLQLLAEGGLAIFVPALVLLLSLARTISKRRKIESSPIFVGLAFSLVCLSLQSIIDFPFRNDLVAILSAVLVGGVLSECKIKLGRPSRILCIGAMLMLASVTAVTTRHTVATSLDREDYLAQSTMLTIIERSENGTQESIEQLEALLIILQEQLPRSPLAPELHSNTAHAYALLSRASRTGTVLLTLRSAEWYEAQAEIYIDNMVRLQHLNPRVYLSAAHIQEVLEVNNPLWRVHRDHRLSSIERVIDLDPWLASFAFADAPGLNVDELEAMRITKPRGEYERGRALLKLGATERALESFKTAVVGLDTWAPAWFMVGEGCRMLGDSDCAINAYDRSLMLNPRNQVMRGWAQYWTGSTAAAIRTFSNILDSNAGHAWASQGLNLATSPQGSTE